MSDDIIRCPHDETPLALSGGQPFAFLLAGDPVPMHCPSCSRKYAIDVQIRDPLPPINIVREVIAGGLSAGEVDTKPL